MKKGILLVLLVSLISCKEDNNNSLAQGIEVDDSYEVKLTIVDYYGLEEVINREDNKTYVVNFWATWCAPCVKELPYFEKLDKEYEDKNVEVVLVSLDFPKKYESKLKPFIKKHQLRSELFALNDMDSNYWIPQVSEDWSGALPATLIYNNGKRQFYERAFHYDELETEIQKFLKK